MSDDPIYTGWLQTQMSGDIDAAKLHERDARRVLGALLTKYGVNELLEAGEPSGFFKDVKTLDDGTRITVWHNNGMNVARIETPARSVQAQPVERGEHEHRDWHEHTVRHGDALSYTDHVMTPQVSLSRQEQHEEEEKKEEITPYMWVGIRSTTPNVPWYAVNAVLIEPATGYKRADYPARGIIESDNYWGGAQINVNLDGSASVLGSGFANFPAAIQNDMDNYGPGTGYDAPMQRGDHKAKIVDYSDSVPQNAPQGPYVSANGLMSFCTNQYSYTPTGFGPAFPVDRWMPYDPMSDDQTGAQRNFGNRHLPNATMPQCTWDAVYTLDAYPDMYPGDNRPHMVALMELLERKAQMATGEAKFLPGEYLLAVHMEDGAPTLRSTRAGQAIPNSSNQRSATSDYDDYMRPTNATINTGIEIEVRLNKDDQLAIFHFTSTVASCDDRRSNTGPFGYPGTPFDACSAEGGPNPLGPDWMQGLIAIDPTAGVASWSDDIGKAAPILGGGQYALPNDSRKELLICVYGSYGVTPTDDSNWADNAAYAAWRVLEECSAGVYGEQLFKETSQSALRDIFAGGDRAKVNILNCYTGKLEVVPVISQQSDYDYSTGSPYQQDMYWYYPYKLRLKANCQHSMGIVVTSDITGYDFITGQTVLTGEPSPPDCCT